MSDSEKTVISAKKRLGLLACSAQIYSALSCGIVSGLTEQGLDWELQLR